MSYDIDSIEIIYHKNFSAGQQFRDFVIGYEGDDAPEDSVLDPGWTGFADAEVFPWCGEGSGRSFVLLQEVLATFDGDADLVLTWEGGDSHSGLRLRGHRVTHHEVKFTLQDGEIR